MSSRGNKYEIDKILFSHSQFSKFKNAFYKKKFFCQHRNERLNEIKLSGKNLLLANIKYKEQTGEKYKSFKIYGTPKSISLLNNEDITQYFVDTTYKCLPNEIEEAKSLFVLIGYNSKKDLFELILVAILSD